VRHLRSRLGLLVGLVASVASIAYIVASWRGQDMRAFASPRAIAALGSGVVFYMAGVLITARAWQRLLSDIGISSKWRDLAGILAVTQVGKYLPGNVGQHIGRATMAFSRGIAPVPFVVTAGVELLLMMLASVTVGISALLLSGKSFALIPANATQVLVLVMVFIATAIVGLLLARKLAPSLIRRFAPRHAHAFNAGTLPSASAMSAAFSMYCLVYLAFGGGIVLMAHILTPGIPQDAWLLVGSFALAWIIGFATPGAPAGLGVREAVMLLIIGTSYPAAAAAAIVVALRVVTTLGDLVLFPIGLLLATKPLKQADMTANGRNQ